MPDQHQENMQKIARLQLLLSHRVAIWYTFVKANPLDQRTANAALLAVGEAKALLKAVQDAAGIDG